LTRIYTCSVRKWRTAPPVKKRDDRYIDKKTTF
jgi:hypothetical protein